MDWQAMNSKTSRVSHGRGQLGEFGPERLSDIEWASAFLPVLAIEQGIDLAQEVPAAIRSRIVKRSDLAARLHVQSSAPPGAQLAARGELSYDQARSIDANLFRNRPLNLRLRFDNTVDDVRGMLRRLQSIGLIDHIKILQEHHGYWFVEFETRQFMGLAEILAREIPDLAVLLSINDSVLYI